MTKEELQGGFLSLWTKVRVSEVAEAVAAITRFQELAASPRLDSPEWWNELTDALLTAAEEATDVTKDDADDEFVAKFRAVQPQFAELIAASFNFLAAAMIQFQIATDERDCQDDG